MRRSFIPAAAFALALARAAAAQTTPLSGTVTGPAGALGNAGVQVFTSNSAQSTTTDAQGRFSIDVPTGNVTLRISGPEGSGLADDFIQNLQVDEPLDGRFTLKRAATISGRCVPRDPLTPGLSVTIYSTTTLRSYQPNPAAFLAGIAVVPDVYAILCSSNAGGVFGGRVNVDVRNVDARGVDVPVEKDPLNLTKTPPRASLITIGAPDDLGVATVSGAAGAVEALSAVMVANLQTQQVSLAASNADGSFSAKIFAPPGSFIQVKHDPTGRYLPEQNFNGTLSGFSVPPGTVIYVPAASGFATGAVANYYDSLHGSPDFWRWERFGVVDPGQWWASGTLDKTSYAPGDSFTAGGKITVYSRNIDSSLDVSKVQIQLNLQFDRLFDTSGRAFQPIHQFSSTMMTPTGLPIEEMAGGAPAGQIRIDNVRLAGPSRLEADWSVDTRVPSNFPPGLYRPTIGGQFHGIPLTARHLDVFPSVESGPKSGAALPEVRVGAPGKQRLYWVLGIDDIENGLRGGVAVEDRGKFAVASHVITSTEAQIVPPRRYRLEPYVPMIAYSTARLTDTPLIPLRFPSGSLTVRVTKPDGSVDDLGSAPFAQSTSRTPLTRSGLFISNSSASVTDFYQLTTLDPRFDYDFTQFGRYTVQMSGTVDDVWGNRYEGGGTYEVDVARPLDLEFGVLPGTPFEVGNRFAPLVVVQPPVAADVEIKLRLLPNSDSTKAVVQTISGRANRFGFFAPRDGLAMLAPGEYRADVTARFTDAGGTLWVGAATWGSVVATPNAAIVTKGRRGFDGVNDRIQQQWLHVRDARAGGDHLMFPFHGGDVMWMQKDDPAADIPEITLQDGDGTFGPRVTARRRLTSTQFDGFQIWDQRLAAGEIPLFSSSSTSIAPVFDPDNTDQWGYFYGAAERPGVHVREVISGDSNGNGYWRFNDNYHFQLGNGTGGDLPNDFKFQFGGAVWRQPKDNFFYYGAYASLFVLLPFHDAEGGRIFPAFQGNGGGPSGGPLFTLKGKAIDLFFHPTGVRPGTILQLGDIASFAGYSAPPLPSKIEVTITSPSGLRRTISGRASKVGYFYDPGYDFAVNEPGVWTAKVSILFDGTTSAGPVQPPYPTGDVLGSRGGEFNFYVVRGDSAPLALAPMPQVVHPAQGRITFTVNPPPGLHDMFLSYTATMPGFILEESSGGSPFAPPLAYTYDAQTLAKDFPNLDLFDGDGGTGADTVSISLFLSGTDAAGQRQYFARQVVIQGEELQMPEQTAAPIPARRRSARR